MYRLAFVLCLLVVLACWFPALASAQCHSGLVQQQAFVASPLSLAFASPFVSHQQQIVVSPFVQRQAIVVSPFNRQAIVVNRNQRVVTVRSGLFGLRRQQIIVGH